MIVPADKPITEEDIQKLISWLTDSIQSEKWESVVIGEKMFHRYVGSRFDIRTECIGRRLALTMEVGKQADE